MKETEQIFDSNEIQSLTGEKYAAPDLNSELFLLIKKFRCIREKHAAARFTGGKAFHSTHEVAMCQIDSFHYKLSKRLSS